MTITDRVMSLLDNVEDRGIDVDKYLDRFGKWMKDEDNERYCQQLGVGFTVGFIARRHIRRSIPLLQKLARGEDLNKKELGQLSSTFVYVVSFAGRAWGFAARDGQSLSELDQRRKEKAFAEKRRRREEREAEEARARAEEIRVKGEEAVKRYGGVPRDTSPLSSFDVET